MNGSDEGSSNPPHNENEQKKKGKGRQKIAMAKIENETNLQVTFSKRRGGVFKKASELSTLCGAESAVVVFSPGNKPHSFGHPDVETVANRFLNATATGGGAPPMRTSAADQLMMAHNEVALQHRNQELVAIEAELERERRRKRELDGGGQLQLPQPPLDGMDYQQLDRLRKSVLDFKRDFEAKVKSGSGSSSSSAADPGAAAQLGFSFLGYGNGGGGGAGSSYNYLVQYGGAPGYNYSDPSAVVAYHAANNAGANNGNGGGADDLTRYQGFGTNNYHRPNF